MAKIVYQFLNAGNNVNKVNGDWVPPEFPDPPSSPFRRLRLFRTSRERNTLYNSHPVTQLGPYSPSVIPRSNHARVTGLEFRQISRIPHRCLSGRMWCQKNGGRIEGSFLRFSSRFELSWFNMLYTTMASSYGCWLVETPRPLSCASRNDLS